MLLDHFSSKISGFFSNFAPENVSHDIESPVHKNH